MKKTLFMAFAAIMAFASCGNSNKTEQASDAADSIVAEAVEGIPEDAQAEIATLADNIKTADAAKVQSTLEKLQAKYVELVNEGKIEEAKKVVVSVQNYIKENADQINSLVAGNESVAKLIDCVKNIPVSSINTAEDALSAVKGAQDLIDKAKSVAGTSVDEKVEEVKAAAKAKVDEKVEEAKANAKAKVNEKVDEAKKKASDAASKAINDAASKLLSK